MRLFRHLVCDWWSVRSRFPQATLARIESKIGEQEARHDGELRFAVEAALPVRDLLHGMSSRERAIEIFTRLHVWDTEHNSGVLFYVLLADKRIEIVADRGIDQRVGKAAWDVICGEVDRAFAAGRFEEGALLGLQAVSDLLATHFPPRSDNPNELPNRPVVL
ncbi:MAG: TPM domain-containing protein [Burkholderiales bacterium]